MFLILILTTSLITIQSIDAVSTTVGDLQDHFNKYFRTLCSEEVYKQNEQMIFQETTLNLTAQPIQNNKLGI